MMGSERRSMVISEREKMTTAVHEAGHALVARILPGTDPVHKVTIIPRGRALGLTQQLPKEDRLNINQEFALNQIAILMGGRIAEELTFDQKTTGAGNDIEVATALARSMVCEWGMSEMGRWPSARRRARSSSAARCRRCRPSREETARAIDAEVHRIVMSQYARARAVLEEHRATLQKIADALIEYETIDTADIDVLMSGGALTRTPPVKPMVTTQVVDKAKAPLATAAGHRPRRARPDGRDRQ